MPRLVKRFMFRPIRDKADWAVMIRRAKEGCHSITVSYSPVQDRSSESNHMILLAQINSGMDAASRHVGVYAAMALAVVFIWRIIHWFINGPKTPDPWDEQVAAELAGEDAQPICPHCLTAHDELQHFCSDCGAPVGTCTNLMPFVYLFSISHILRIGTSETFKRSRFLIVSFFFLGLAQYSIFAPVYWFKLLKNVARMRHLAESEVQTSIDRRQ